MATTPPAASPLVADATTGHGGVVPVQTRNERFTSYDVTEFPRLTGREVAFKYTPIDRLEPLTGVLAAECPSWNVTAPGDGATVRFVDRSDARIGTAGIPEDRIAANAWSSFTKAMAIEVTSEQAGVVTIARRFPSAPTAAHTIVDVAPNANAVLVLENRGHTTLAENVEIVVGDGASLTLVTVQDWSDESLHVANHFAQVGRDAKLKHIVVSLGGSVVRVNPSVTLAGSGASAELFGVYFADAGQHLEQQVFLFHKADHTVGRVNYKGALQGAGAHTVWIGDVLIGPDAVGTDSYEQNRNLVLSDGTRADSVPNLEIETGDILGAGHASATGRFDDEQLFYLQARGITEDEARRLVVRGFLADIVQRIGVPALEARLHAAIEQELAGNSRG